MGNTEVLESAFGIQKRLSGDQAQSGRTSAVLGEMSAEPMCAELERVPEQAVWGWAQRWFGATVQWLRRKFLRNPPADPVPDPVPKLG